MGCSLKNSPAASRIFPCLLLLAIVALPLQQQSEGVSTFSSTFVVVLLKVKAALPEQKLTFKILSVADRLDQTPKINPSLLRIDLKQNLLVWPNVASDLTRSPPSTAAGASLF
jgi:hypothetical protein